MYQETKENLKLCTLGQSATEHGLGNILIVYVSKMIMLNRKNGRAMQRIMTVLHSCYYLKKTSRLWWWKDTNGTMTSLEDCLAIRR